MCRLLEAFVRWRTLAKRRTGSTVVSAKRNIGWKQRWTILQSVQTKKRWSRTLRNQHFCCVMFGAAQISAATSSEKNRPQKQSIVCLRASYKHIFLFHVSCFTGIKCWSTSAHTPMRSRIIVPPVTRASRVWRTWRYTPARTQVS